MLNVDDLPYVAKEQRPKPLYIATSLTHEEEEKAGSKGWMPIDVRLMPSEQTADRIKTCFAFLEGHRQGSISLSKLQLDSIELELRACGQLAANKAPPEGKKDDLSKKEIDEVLSGVKSSRAGKGTQRRKDVD